MLQIKLVLFGLSVVGAIGLAFYSHYKQRQQQQQSFDQRPRRSNDTDDIPQAIHPSRSNLPSLRNKSVQCSICLVKIDGSKLRNLKCGHSFHTDCIQVWFNGGSSTCPNCRANAL